MKHAFRLALWVIGFVSLVTASIAANSGTVGLLIGIALGCMSGLLFN